MIWLLLFVALMACVLWCCVRINKDDEEYKAFIEWESRKDKT